MTGSSRSAPAGVAVVTGAGSGIGRACALRLAASGHAVAATDVDADAAATVARELTDRGALALGLGMDVTDQDQVDDITDRVTRELGHLTVSVCSAGVGAPTAPFAATSLDHWRHVVDVDLTGVFLSLRSHVRAMVEGGGGSAVVVGSVLSLASSAAQATPYVAAKHALLGLVKQAAVDHGGQGVRVNTVLPGYVRTPLALARLSPAELEARERSQPLGRMADPDEIAAAVAWLAGPESSFVTGTHLLVDGGHLARQPVGPSR